jgi:hypothetical protein
MTILLDSAVDNAKTTRAQFAINGILIAYNLSDCPSHADLLKMNTLIVT